MSRSLDYFASISPFKRDAQILTKLVVRYGSSLEQLSQENRFALRAVLSKYIYYKSFITEYLIVDAIIETLPDFSDRICAVLIELQGLSDKSIEILIELITLQQTNEFITD